jgi:hypothetical protein
MIFGPRKRGLARHHCSDVMFFEQGHATTIGVDCHRESASAPEPFAESHPATRRTKLCSWQGMAWKATTMRFSGGLKKSSQLIFSAASKDP